jgi:uncharacterized damage-inducible protein DinB
MDDVLMWASALLTTTPKRWMNLVESLSTELVTQPPAPGEWSALECLLHIIDAERGIFPVRIKALLNGQSFPAFFPDTEGSKLDEQPNPLDLVAEFARLRTENLSLLATITPMDLAKPGVHPELGPVTLGEIVHQWVAHDFNHTIQAERALMQPFIQGCKPWREYFIDHVVEAKHNA